MRAFPASALFALSPLLPYSLSPPALYAKAGIAVYWIVNLIDRRIEVYSEPAGTGDAADYRLREDVGETGHVSLVIDGREVAKIAAKDLRP